MTDYLQKRFIKERILLDTRLVRADTSWFRKLFEKSENLWESFHEGEEFRAIFVKTKRIGYWRNSAGLAITESHRYPSLAANEMDEAVRMVMDSDYPTRETLALRKREAKEEARRSKETADYKENFWKFDEVERALEKSDDL